MVMKMKDSGIEWIGEIPADWEVRRLKYVGEAIIGLTYSPEDITDESGLLVLRSSNVQDNKIVFDDNVYVSKNVSAQLIVQQGDILLCSRNGSSSLIGKSAVIDEKSAGNTFGAFMTIFRSKHNKFLKLVFNSPLFKNQSGLFLTTTINQLTNAILYNFVVVMPPMDHQQKIADFLDARCAEIDAIIAAKQQQNDLLKEQRQSIIFEVVTKGLDPTVTYKDSGVEWIGEMPEGWEVKRLKLIAGIIDGDRGPDYPSENDILDEGILFLSSDNIKNNAFNFSKVRFISPEKYEKLGRGKLCKGDIVITVRGTIGSIALFDAQLFSAAFINAQMMIIRIFNDKANEKWLYYMALSECWGSQLDCWSYGTAQQQLSNKILSNLLIPIPCYTEQQQIADYLDIRCTELDRVVSANNAVIEKLKEYRQSLIYEAVTGKIAV